MFPSACTEEATPVVQGDRKVGQGLALSVEMEVTGVSELQGLVLPWEHGGCPVVFPPSV